MKNFLIILCCHLCFSNSFSQELLPEKTAEDYRQMSKSQQIGGIILLAAGVTTLTIASQADIPLDDLPIVIILGGLTTVGGTTLLIASGKNEKKARALTASLSLNKLFFEDIPGKTAKPIPSLSLRVKL